MRGDDAPTAGWTGPRPVPIIKPMIGEPVGREREITVLKTFVSDPDPNLRVAVIAGHPGIGKTTLWRSAVEAGRALSYAVLASRPAAQERDLANVVLGDLFRDVPRSAIEALPGSRRHALEAALLMGDRIDAGVEQRSLGVAVATVLTALSHRRPVLVAIDDDQWMDPSSASALAFALRRIADRPVRLLLARRAGESATEPLERAADDAAITRLDVGPLSLGATQLLLQERLGLRLSRPTIGALHAAAHGNPFHALELGRERSRDATRDLALPLSESSVDELVRERLAALDRDVTECSLFVAANGRTPVELLETLGIELAVIDRAIDAGVLERSGDSIGFTHPLLAAGVYDAAGSDGRRHAHRRLAAAIADPVQRGRHVALGAARRGASISAELESVARTARERGQPLAAADLAERAADLTPAEAVEDGFRRTLLAARTRLESGDGERARVLATRLLETSAGTWRAEALLLESDMDNAPDSVANLDVALRLAGPEPRLRAVIHSRLAADGRLTRGRAWAERHAGASVRLAEALKDDGLRARALSMTGLLRYEAADPVGFELAMEAYRLAREVRDESAVRVTATTVGHILTWSRDPAEARSWWVDQLAALGDRDELSQGDWRWYLAIVELRAGRWDLADGHEKAAAEVHALYASELPQDHLPGALLALHRGAFDVARRRSERALSLRNGMRAPTHLAILATIDLWTGDVDRSIVGFERAQAEADGRGFVEPAMRPWLDDYAEALLRVGRIEDAERVVDDWEHVPATIGRDREMAAARRSRGLIATARGDLDTALGLLDDAAARHDAASDRFGWARAKVATGVVHLRRKQKRLAREAFESAELAFDALGATSWAAEARAHLARIGGRIRMEGLSPSERRVAELVAEGQTNRDIAATLFVTERTVASHLAHVYSKLGIRSRTQLARYVTDQATNLPSS